MTTLQDLKELSQKITKGMAEIRAVYGEPLIVNHQLHKPLTNVSYKDEMTDRLAIQSWEEQ